MPQSPITFPRIQEKSKRRIIFIFCVLVGINVFGLLFIYEVVRNLYLLFYSKSQYTFSIAGIYEYIFIIFIGVVSAGSYWYLVRRNAHSSILKLFSPYSPDPKDTYHKVFLNIIEEFKAATSLRRVKAFIIPESYMNAYTIHPWEGGPIVVATEGLVSRLTRPQLQAVIAHEFSHIVNGDAKVATMITGLFGSYRNILLKANRFILGKGDANVRLYALFRLARKNIVFFIVLYICINIIISFLWVVTRLLNLSISRQQEIRADATAVKILRDPLSLAQALHSIYLQGSGRVHEKSGVSILAFVHPKGDALHMSNSFWNFFETHPPINERMETLIMLAKMGRSGFMKVSKEKLSNKRLKIQYKNPALDDDFSRPFLRQITELNTGDESSGKTCPRCRNVLIHKRYEGIMIYSCPHCEGKLIKEDDFHKIILREEYGFDEYFQDKAMKHKKEIVGKRIKGKPCEVDTTETLVCPLCHKDMVRNYHSLFTLVIIDRCYRCKIIWFDADELEILQLLTEQSHEEIIKKRKSIFSKLRRR